MRARAGMFVFVATVFVCAWARHAEAQPNVAQTPDGAVYNTATCLPGDDQGRLVIFYPGTGGAPVGFEWFVSEIGARTGLCAIAVPYENTQTIGGCCTTVPNDPDGPPDADCLEAVLGAKAVGNPSTYTCTNGFVGTITPAQSAAGRTTKALLDVGMENYLDTSGGEPAPRWIRLVLGGHSQGTQIANYLGKVLYGTAGIAHIAGGAPLNVVGTLSFYEALFVTPKTVPSRHRAFHHINDGHAGRMAAYAMMGLPSRNITTTDDTSEQCNANPHNCVISDSWLPFAAGHPVFSPDWEWLVSPTPGACPTPAPAFGFVRRTKLKFDRVDPGGAPNDDRIKLKAIAESDELDFTTARPDLDGARVTLLAADGTIVTNDVLPGGLYAGAGTAGWRRNTAGTKWTYRDKTGAPVNGIVKLTAKATTKGGIGRYRLSLAGKQGNYPVTAATLPLTLVVEVGDALGSAAGTCAEAAFTSAECTVSGAGGERIVCVR